MKRTMLQSQTKDQKQGLYITNGVILQLHEQRTVNFLLSQSFDIELIPKSNKQGERTADIIMSGLEWEIKAPKGEGKYLIQNTLHRAAHQSENLVIDLYRIKIHQTKCLQELKKNFHDLKRLKRLMIITKTHKIIDFIK